MLWPSNPFCEYNKGDIPTRKLKEHSLNIWIEHTQLKQESGKRNKQRTHLGLKFKQTNYNAIEWQNKKDLANKHVKQQ